MISAPFLELRDVSVTFPVTSGRRWPWSPAKKLHAVSDVSLTLSPGETLGIVGESGCGKSTLIRAIAGLAPPTSGIISFEGAPIDYTDRGALRSLRQNVQMIFQDPVASLNPRMTIREIVSEPLRFFRPDLAPSGREAALEDMLDRVGIARRNFNRYPHEFSGGQCQRIGIARALVARPKILLCDEPVSALDVSIQAQVVNLLTELQSEMGLALIFVAHDLGVVSHISDRIMVMYLGRIMEEGPARSIVDAPQHPYTRALLSAVPVPDPAAEIKVELLSGDLPSPLAPPLGCPFESRCPVRVERCASERPAHHMRTDGGSVSCHLAEG